MDPCKPTNCQKSSAGQDCSNVVQSKFARIYSDNSFQCYDYMKNSDSEKK